MATKQELWDQWTDEYIDPEDPVSLFNTNSEEIVQTIKYGNNTRPVVERNPNMDRMIREEGQKVVDDHLTASKHMRDLSI